MHLFTITDGTTTISLKDTAAICVEPFGYAPRISEIIGNGRFDDVSEVISLRIKGTTDTQVLERLRSLAQMANRANTFALGETTAAVTLRYQQTSTSSIYSVLVLKASLTAPGNFIRQGEWKLMFPVKLGIERRGQWVKAGIAGDTATATAVNNGDVAALTFAAGAEPFPSPVKVTATNVNAGFNHGEQVLITASGENRIKAVNAAALTASTNFSKVNDAASFARGDEVLRFTPPAADTWYAQTNILPGATVAGPTKRVAIFITARNNSSTVSFFIRAFNPSEAGDIYTRTPVLIPPAAVAKPQVVYVGDLPIPIKQIRLECLATATGATLDMNTFNFVILDDVGAFFTTLTERLRTSTAAGTIILDPATITALEPKASFVGDFANYVGDGEVAIAGAKAEALLLGTGEVGGSVNRWRQTAGAIEAVATNNWTLDRLPARLTPE